MSGWIALAGVCLATAASFKLAGWILGARVSLISGIVFFILFTVICFPISMVSFTKASLGPFTVETLLTAALYLFGGALFFSSVAVEKDGQGVSAGKAFLIMLVAGAVFMVFAVLAHLVAPETMKEFSPE